MLSARFPVFVHGSTLPRNVDRIVESVFHERPPLSAPARQRPLLNAWEDAENVHVEAEVPGFHRENLEITVQGNELVLSGARDDAAPTGATVHRRERQLTTFTRTVRIGGDIDPGRVSATLSNGVLTVTIGKREAAKPRKIDVKNSN